VIDNGEVMVTKGTLTIFGVAKSDAGSASNFEQTLGAVSHCFKRAAVHWGVGRYLYNLPMTWVQVEKGGRIPDAVVRDLRAKLPRPSEQVSQKEESATQRRMTSVPHEATARESAASPARETASESPATEQQLVSIRKLSVALGKAEPEGTLTFAQARQAIAQLSGEYQRARRAS
jgi:hypothetical protein